MRDVQGDVFEVFTGTPYVLAFDVKTRCYYALTNIILFFFHALKMMTPYVNVKTETKIGREQVYDGIQIVPRMSHGERTDGEATAQRTRV